MSMETGTQRGFSDSGWAGLSWETSLGNQSVPSPHHHHHHHKKIRHMTHKAENAIEQSRHQGTCSFYS